MTTNIDISQGRNIDQTSVVKDAKINGRKPLSIQQQAVSSTDELDGLQILLQCAQKIDSEENMTATKDSTLDEKVQGSAIEDTTGTKMVYKCDKVHCTYKTDKKANWYKHRKTHTAVKSHKCPECPYETKTACNLARHLLIHSGTKKYECNICDMKFNQKNNLDRHVKDQHKTKTVSCEECKRFYNNLASLSRHMSSKHKAVPGILSSLNMAGQAVIKCMDNAFKCEDCGDCFSNRKQYRQHCKVHAKGSELQFYCESCSFVTDCKSRMDKHRRSHTQEKPYQCDMCSYKSNSRANIVQHIRTKHKIKSNQSCRTAESDVRDTSSMDKTEKQQTEESMNNFAGETRLTDISGNHESTCKKINNIIESEKGNDRSQFNTKESNPNVVFNDGIEDSHEYTHRPLEGLISTSLDIVSGCDTYTVNMDTVMSEVDKNNVNNKEILSDKNCGYTAEDKSHNAEEQVEIRSLPQNNTINLSDEQIDSKQNGIQSEASKKTKVKSLTKSKSSNTGTSFRQAQKHFGCNMCSMQFHKLRSLYSHIHGQHPQMEINKLRCVICAYEGKTKGALYTHMRSHTHYKNIGIDSSNMLDGQYVCLECNQVMRDKDTVNSHKCLQYTLQNDAKNTAKHNILISGVHKTASETVVMETDGVMSVTIPTVFAIDTIISENEEAVKALLKHTTE